MQAFGGTVWSPVSGHIACVKFAPAQPVVLWQSWQVVAKLLCWCGGLVVEL